MPKRKYSLSGGYPRGKRPRYGGMMNYLPYVVPFVTKKLGYGKSGYESNTKRGASGVVTSAQHDVQRQYVKKYMPRRKKRIWKKFVRKVKASMMKSVGTNTVIRNLNRSFATGLAQQFAACHLYGFNGIEPVAGFDIGTDDIKQIFSQDTRIDSNHKIVFMSAVLDLTMRNSGENDAEVDIYEIEYRDRTQSNSFWEMEGNASNTVTNIPGVVNGVRLITRGATVFDLPKLIVYGKIKVVKKTKVFLPKGNTSNYQIRDARNRIFDGGELADDIGYIKPGYTRTVLLIAKSIVGLGSTDISYAATRKYSYKITQDAQDHDGFF